MEKGEGKPCLELNNVSKKFPGVIAVDHISLKVEQGQVFSLLGPSGCGKTTTLRLIAGLEAIDEGEISIDNKIVNDLPPYRRDCSTVFQTLALFPHMTVEENIAYGLASKKLPPKKIEDRVGEMIGLMRLGGMEKRRPSQISGGQRQRVALARSLVLKPKILLLDEPLASLDRKLRKEMQVEIKRIQKEVGITFLYVTHDQKVALSISDKIAVMNKGRLEQVAAPDKIYDAPKTEFVADFIGASNVFTSKVIDCDGATVHLQTEKGLKVSAIRDKEITEEEIVGISIHPELIEILAKDSDLKKDNVFLGKIVEMIYQGDFIELKICLNQTDELITASYSSILNRKNRLTLYKEVLVHWSPENSSILSS